MKANSGAQFYLENVSIRMMQVFLIRNFKYEHTLKLSICRLQFGLAQLGANRKREKLIRIGWLLKMRTKVTELKTNK